MNKHCVICVKSTTKRCQQCKIVYYCSKKCQKQDWLIHKMICKKTLPEFCKSIYQLHLNHFCDDILCKIRPGPLLNNNIHIFYKDNVTYKIRIREYDGIIIDNRLCILCGNDIMKDDYIGLNDTIVYSKKDYNQFCYYRCSLCKDKDLTICPFSFETSLKCKSKIFMIIFCLKNYEYILPKDILYEIVNLINLIKCCK